MGLVAVPPLPSQKYRSPIKVGEYLSCGLPYLVCDGISEDDLIARKYDVGVVVEDFSKPSLEKSIPIMQDFFYGKRKFTKEMQDKRPRIQRVWQIPKNQPSGF